MNLKKSLVIIVLLGASGCVSARGHMADLHSAEERRLTAGVVQREIREGMSQGDVAAALGSPNIVSRDADGAETWIYDKIATEASYSRSDAGYGGVLGAGGPVGSILLLGLGGGSYGEEAGASAQTERTLTVIIKFNRGGAVQSAAYHSTTF